jgi:soluble P-type ATPase
VCALGNGANDEKLLARAALSLCVLGEEGAAGAALRAADMVVRSPVEALDALLDPLRLVSTLRL